MRLFKLKPNINWKYVFGEIFLIFVGINLAIWFNNWNTSKSSHRAKRVAIAKITDEINSNKNDLEDSYQNAVLTLGAMQDIKALYHENSSTILTSPEKMAHFQKNYPGFYRIQDSIPQDSSLVLYKGGTFIELELVELSEIAWETTKGIDILNEFGYECLYQLESMYNLQRRVQNEINKAGDALQKGDFDDLSRILSFIQQLEEQLKEAYEEMLKNIKNCI